MPLRVRITETPTQKKIRELVERTPIVKWIFPSLPAEVRSGEQELDLPTVASMMGPAPVGLTRLQAWRSLSNVLGGRATEPVLAKVAKIPKKILHEIEDIVPIEKIQERLKTTLPEGILGAHYPGFYSGERSLIGLSKYGPPETAWHELGHQAFDMMASKDKALLRRAFEEKWKYFNYRNELEMFADAFRDYISFPRASAEVTWKRYPPVIKHLVKKYYRLLR